jgi:hypothetical protein
MAKVQELTTTLFVLLTLAITSIIAPAYLSTAPYVSELKAALGPDSCSGPCWHGIILGKTTIAEAEQMLAADSKIVLLGDDHKGCPVRWNMVVDSIEWQGRICSVRDGALTDPVNWLELGVSDKEIPSRLTVFEALLMLGKPIGSECKVFTPHLGPKVYQATIVFRNNIAIGWKHDMPYTGLLFNPAASVDWIRYYGPGSGPFFMPDSWHGFTSKHLEFPRFAECMIAVE